MEFKIVKDYKDNNKLRLSFNKLAEETFGLNFEDWYQNGYWTDKYNPYSIELDGKIIANVSVNIMDFIFEDKEFNFIQLGTVMTEKNHRNKGFIKILMAEIEKDFKEKDGIYLFANDSVLNFYTKFRFKKSIEYQYSKSVGIKNNSEIKKLPMNNKELWDNFIEIMKNNKPIGKFEMKDNYGLNIFYISKFMNDSVYYLERLKAYVIADFEEEELIIHNVFSKEDIDLDEIINSFGQEIKNVRLNFTPKDIDGYEIKVLEEEGTTLFVKGKDLTKENKLMFPSLSHA